MLIVVSVATVYQVVGFQRYFVDLWVDVIPGAIHIVVVVWEGVFKTDLSKT